MIEKYSQRFDKCRCWDCSFLDMAETIAKKSKDPSTKVGAVIVDDQNRPVSWGYNGFPRKIEDTPERLNNRDLKLQHTVHAEINAILFAERSRLEGATLYTYPFMPCSDCCILIIQSGIQRVVSYNDDTERWQESFEKSKTMFKEAGIQLFLYEKE